MCGITGFISKTDSPQAEQNFKHLLTSLKHRGPDSQGQAINKRVGIGMRRLSIVDVTGGDQPFYSEDGSIVIVGNGEIYNYPEIVSRIKHRHQLSSRSDIEIILHLYEDLGVKCLQKIKGMFAFALYDRKRDQLFIARDRWGEKPLYYTYIQDTFYFASELRSLMKLKGVSKSWQPSALNTYFHYYYIPEKETALTHIHKLPAASYALINTKTLALTIQPYWQPSYDFKKLQHPAEEIRQALTKAFNRTMMADVPVGIALSGGIDSSAILALLGPENRDTLTAYTIGYEHQPPTDERKIAAKLSKHFGIEFIETELKDRDVVENFPQIVREMDDPIADIAAQGVSAVSRTAREHGAKVLLSGVGGDELFWGYPWLRQSVDQTLKHFADNPTSQHVLLAEQKPAYLGARRFINNLTSSQFKSRISEQDLSDYTYYPHAKTKLRLARHFLELSRDMWLQPDVLVLNDRVGMAHSIEMRAPFLDTDLTELIFTSQQTVGAFNLSHKHWLQAALGETLPDYIWQKKKQGFTPPVARWLSKIIHRYQPLLQDGFLVNENIVSPHRIRLMRASWVAWPFFWYQIYQLLVLEIWGRSTIYGQTLAEIKQS